MEMEENLLINPFEANCKKHRESNGCELTQYSEHNNETTRPLTLVDKQCSSGKCSENCEQHYEQGLEPGNLVYEKTSFESQQQESGENRTLHDIPLNHRLVDFHSSYYDEIQNYIHTKTVPDNASISYKMLLKKRAKNYSIKEGILLYGTKIVLKTKAEQIQALEKTHVEKNTGIHLGVKKMSHIINSKWYWRGQYVDIANFVRQCSKCTELSRTSISKEHSKYESCNEDPKLLVHEIWKKVEVHIHGPHTNKNSEAVFIATIVDPVSRYIVARILPTDDFPSHLSSLILETFCTFGVVKCYFGETCTQHLETVKLILKNQNNFIEKVKLFCQHSLENFLFILQKGEEECLWVQSCLEPYIANYSPPCERDLCVYIFELNTNISGTSPFIRMFNRKPCVCSEEDKENTHSDVSQNKNGCSRFSQRRLLRCSVLQCRHCEEVFTSKISFRIHQRKHTEEAHRQGMLEGQSRCPVERERRIMRRPLLKYKHLSARRRSHLQSERNPTMIAVEVRDNGTLQADIPAHRRAELRASTVEAVRRLLAKTKDNKKCRGKYKKFSSEIQEQMARYAMDHGSLLTVRHFSEKLGVMVSESTVRNIVKWYQCFTPEVKEEIGRFAATFGIEAAASHFSERLGREVRFGLIRKFKKVYLSRFTDAKLCKNGKKTDRLKVLSTHGVDSQNKTVLRSSDKKEEMELNSSDRCMPLTLDHFSEQFKTNSKGNIRKCRKLYKDKQSARVEQELPAQQQFPLEQSPRELQHQPVHQQIQQGQKQQHQQHQHLLPPALHHNSLDVQQLQHHGHEPMQQEALHQQLPQQLPQQPQQMLQQHEPVPCDSGVTLLAVQQHSSDSDLQETVVQPSSQTIDILQTSLNLLNNPQLNNSAAIIYNTPYQIPSTSHIPSNQLLPINQQQNTSITFQATSQCNDNNVPSTVPLPYQPQDISASVMINQNVAAVQTFPSSQVYPPFAQAQTVQPAALAVSDNTLSLSSQNGHMAPLAHHTSAMSSHSSLPTITVAVAPIASDSHFQPSSHQPTVVLSQSMSQPILVSHSQPGTSLLQHIIGSHPHLQAGPAHLSQHVMRDVHPNAGHASPFAQVVEQQQHMASDSYSQSLNGNISSVSYNAPVPFINESRDASFALPRNANYVQTIEMKEDNGYEQLPSLKSHVAVEKIGEEIESPEKGNVPISQSTSQCSSDVAPTEDSEGIEQCDDAILEENVQRERNDENCRTTQTSSRKNVKKKDKKVSGKGRNKSNEQKRGTYATYSPEIRAEMGKYAAEYGSQKACVYFRNKHGYNVAESTMRGLRDKYLRKRELYAQDSEGDVTSLGYAPRGRPMRLGQYDEVVQECMQELVKSGEKISSFLAIATAKHVLMQYEPHLLEENGGKIKLNVTWAKSFLKRSGIKNYS